MEVLKSWECETSSEEEEHNNSNEDNVHTVAFALGTVVLMVCLKRFLVEQWRAWVFLLLNVILLAIFFMSTKKPRWSVQTQESQNRIQPIKTHLKKDSVPPRSEESKECSENNVSANKKMDGDEDKDEGEEEEEEEAVAALSKEELNERVEAFIAMFRQHLISDVKQGFNFPQTANLRTRPNKIQVPCC
ncbi:uncharacterized protein LOC130954894 [Arachis stenosperma]|uniref:uncharacterized protein LOC130954894 n=1 Tax=Arachis stenosperma TaxID=217475 RepID=UPI0025ACE237|nr:uncharacterized protein LOC130954894 [Arachis stenosperma]